MRGVQIATVLVLGMLAIGCGGDVTEVIVVTDSDLDVPGELDELFAQVTAPDGTSKTSTAPLTAGSLPRSVGLVHETGPLGPFEVRVVGRWGGNPIVERRARFDFVQGETRVLTMHLVRDCLGAGCGGGQACSESGCRPIDVSAGELSDWTGRPPRLDDGPPDTDGGPACTPTDESCNGEDDDCDDSVDEDFDLMSDPENCGMCGNACRGRNDMCCDGSCERRCN